MKNIQNICKQDGFYNKIGHLNKKKRESTKKQNKILFNYFKFKFMKETRASSQCHMKDV